jgi:hypothetical protein
LRIKEFGNRPPTRVNLKRSLYARLISTNRLHQARPGPFNIGPR